MMHKPARAFQTVAPSSASDRAGARTARMESGPFCRKGPQGAACKRVLPPFLLRQRRRLRSAGPSAWMLVLAWLVSASAATAENPVLPVTMGFDSDFDFIADEQRTQEFFDDNINGSIYGVIEFINVPANDFVRIRIDASITNDTEPDIAWAGVRQQQFHFYIKDVVLALEFTDWNGKNCGASQTDCDDYFQHGDNYWMLVDNPDFLVEQNDAVVSGEQSKNCLVPALLYTDASELVSNIKPFTSGPVASRIFQVKFPGDVPPPPPEGDPERSIPIDGAFYTWLDNAMELGSDLFFNRQVCDENQSPGISNWPSNLGIDGCPPDLQPGQLPDFPEIVPGDAASDVSVFFNWGPAIEIETLFSPSNQNRRFRSTIAGPPESPQAITEIYVFPDSVDIDTGFTSLVRIAPGSREEWAATYESSTPDSEPRPYGGVKWTSTGAGLDTLEFATFESQLASGTGDPGFEVFIDEFVGAAAGRGAAAHERFPNIPPDEGSTITGACCLPGGVCSPMSETLCLGFDGTYFGDGVPCASVACRVPGACCLLSGSCTVVRAETCELADGAYQGDGALCENVDCATPPMPTTGACVLSGPCCEEGTTEGQCVLVGGTYQGNGSTCTDPPCGPTPTGQCCSNDGATCQILERFDCDAIGGSWQKFADCTDSCGPQVYMEPAAAVVAPGQTVTVQILVDGSITGLIQTRAYDIGIVITPAGGNIGTLTPIEYLINQDNPDWVFFGQPTLSSDDEPGTLQGGSLLLSSPAPNVTTPNAYLIQVKLQASIDATGTWNIAFKQNVAQTLLISDVAGLEFNGVDHPGHFSAGTVTVIGGLNNDPPFADAVTNLGTGANEKTNSMMSVLTRFDTLAAYQADVVQDKVITFTEFGTDADSKQLFGSEYGAQCIEFVETNPGEEIFDEIRQDVEFVVDGWGLEGFGKIVITFGQPQTHIGVEFPGALQIELFDDLIQVGTTEQFGGLGTGKFGGVASPLQPFNKVVLSDGFDDEVFIDNLHFDCASDQCGPHVRAVASRFIAILPNPAASLANTPVALRVTNECTQETAYVTFDGTFGEGSLGPGFDDGTEAVSVGQTTPTCDDAQFRKPSEWVGTVYVMGDIIDPASTYSVEAISGSCASPTASPSVASCGCTFSYADTNGDGLVTFTIDLQDIFDNIQLGGWPGPLPGYRLDVQENDPSVPDGFLTFATDLQSAFDVIVDAIVWSGESCPATCPAP